MQELLHLCSEYKDLQIIQRIQRWWLWQPLPSPLCMWGLTLLNLKLTVKLTNTKGCQTFPRGALTSLLFTWKNSTCPSKHTCVQFQAHFLSLQQRAGTTSAHLRLFPRLKIQKTLESTLTWHCDATLLLRLFPHPLTLTTGNLKAIIF